MSKPKSKNPAPAVAEKIASPSPQTAAYVPTPAERAAIGAHVQRRQRQKPAPGIKLTPLPGGAREIEVDHPEPDLGHHLLREALGTTSGQFVGGLLLQLGNASGTGNTRADEESINFMLATIRGIEPRDEVEAMLGAQMAAVHIATMAMTGMLINSPTLPQQDSAQQALNKLARTFTGQMEALKRYRSSSQQTVTVEHVHIHQGGQAVVGNVTHQGGVAQIAGDQPHAAQPKRIEHARGTQMPRQIEAERAAVPGTSGAGQEGLPDARRPRRRS